MKLHHILSFAAAMNCLPNGFEAEMRAPAERRAARRPMNPVTQEAAEQRLERLRDGVDLATCKALEAALAKQSRKNARRLAEAARQ